VPEIKIDKINETNKDTVVEDNSSDSSLGEDSNSDNVKTYIIQMFRYSTVDCHKLRVKQICIHSHKELIYSVGEDKRICVSDINYRRKMLTYIKCSNFTPKTMTLH
jgi:WD40 repeat protein